MFLARLFISSTFNCSNLSTLNVSTANEPMVFPYIIAVFIVCKSVFRDFIKYPVNPPAKESPAPVGSIICVTLNVGALNFNQFDHRVEPCSPFFTTINFTP